MAKTEKLFSKIVMILFLILIVIGFTVPGITNNEQNDPQPIVEPRLCRGDADCYLTCEGQPLPVICVQNLCQQNECGFSYVEYDQNNPIIFKLEVMVDSGTVEAPRIEKFDLASRSRPQNFYVSFGVNDEVTSFSSRLSLNLILDKALILLHDKCIRIDSTSYCENSNYFLSVLVNGQESDILGNYIPQNGDKVSISYAANNPLD